nr:MAG: RNA-dependent RNA-polymerase [Picobirnavirus sp.]
MIQQLPSGIAETIGKNRNLFRYLSELQKQQPATQRSWLYEDLESEKVKELWLQQLAKLQNGSLPEQMVFQFDIKQLSKWGPQGGHAPMAKLLEEVVLPTFKDAKRPIAFESLEWKAAISASRKHLAQSGVGGIRMASYNRVIDDMKVRDTLSSNSGYPSFARRSLNSVKEQAMKDAISGKYKDYPAIALFRTYRGKTRLVWMFPMATNLVEGTTYQPLQNALVKCSSDFFSPWIGFDRVRELITNAYDAGKYIAASDFSSTDAHFTVFSSDQVVKVLLPFMANSESATSLANSINHMHIIPLVIGPDQWITGAHGVSSGSNWTNFIETVFDLSFAKYVNIKLKSIDGFYAIGDDMTWISDNYDVSFANKLERLGKEVGQDIKAEKTTNDKDSVVTLQRLFQRGYSRPDGLLRGVYPTVRALNSLLFPERFHSPKKWSSDMFCCRVFMILENCVDHPLFEEFVKFVVKGNRHLIPFANQASSKIDQAQRKTKLLPGLNPTYNQERRDSAMSTFESIRIARM